MKWAEAVDYAASQTSATGKRTAAGNPELTNREAAGLILFAKGAQEWAGAHGHPVPLVDWYAFALPAVGWNKRGDVFDMSVRQQIGKYPASNELWMALRKLADNLDAAGQDFELVADPAGTETTYKVLADTAWQKMQRESPADAAAATVAAGNRKQPRSSSTPLQPATSSPAADARPREDKRDSGGGLGAIVLIGLMAYALSSED